ncbi:hypothetical protein [Nocardia callitridis]|uniref:Transmembrane protein n=1 Tax=Nocardia callitridis TaxID=648753 RepID=A0ABP9KRV0_9NOCA
MSEHPMSDNDVEKRWHDPSASRHAGILVLGVVVAALIAMVVFGVWVSPRYLVAVIPSAILLVGTLTAFTQTIRTWRRGGAWPIWQGAGWFLLTFALVYLVLASGFVAHDGE